MPTRDSPPTAAPSRTPTPAAGDAGRRAGGTGSAPAAAPRSDQSRAGQWWEASHGERPEIPPPSILLVDDRPENLLALEALLEPLELRVVRAASGEDALRRVLAEDFAVILLDVQMPGTDGIETARLIKARERSRTTPIIFLTALDRDPRRATLGYESGAVDYMFKPVDPDVLRAKVAAFVQLHQHREELAWHQRRLIADAAVRESDERFRLVQKATNDVIWDWDLAANTLRWNELAARVFGVSHAELTGDFAWWAARVHPEDRQRIIDGIHAVIQSGDGHAWSAEYRFRLGDGSYRSFLDRGYVARDATGRPLRMIGAMQDVTARTIAQAGADAARDEAERARREADHLRRRAEEARARADEANRAKSEFLATMSHEIRTPINAVLGYGELLELGLSGPLTADQRHHIGRIRASATHLLGLVNEVLDLAKVEAGRMMVRSERAPAAEVMDSALALVRPQALERGVALGAVGGLLDGAAAGEVAGRRGGVAYVGDEYRVRQILVNLLSNAVKFTEPGGRVTMRCAAGEQPGPEATLAGPGPWTSISVADTGIGIAPERLHAVFEPFVQAEGGHTRTHGGTGLGLAISRRLARLMGGELSATSKPGAGSTFTLWLPAPPAGSEGAEERRINVVDRAAGGAPTAVRPATPPSTPAATPTDRLRGLGVVGAVLREEADRVLAAWVERLRVEPDAPLAREMRAAQLVDHQGSLLDDLAQSLVIIEEAGGEAAALLRDGSAIQRTIAEHHGARRFAQRWSEEGVRRDFALLGEEVERAVRERLPGRAADVADGLAVLGRLIERATEISIGAWRHAAQSQGG
ncbi:MAG: ATP-binding protein [Gemmatimonadaceae bacterium]